MTTRGPTAAGLIVITGGTQGLGAALSVAFARRGDRVIAIYRSNHDAARTLRERAAVAGLSIDTLALDLSVASPEEILQAVRAVSGEDLENRALTLIHGACSPFEPAPFHLVSWEQTQQLLDSALRSSWVTTQALLPWLLKTQKKPRAGSLVHVLTQALGSAESLPTRGFAHYVAAKAALLGLSRALASELQPKGVRVFSVSPGFMPTALTASWDDRWKAAAGTPNDPSQVAARILAIVDDPLTAGRGEDFPV